jgi:predicted Zn-dependent protease
MEMPKAYQLSEKLRELDPDVLSIKHMQDAGYSAYAVMEIISSMITYNLDGLVTRVESLVGVISFDFGNWDVDDKGKTE